MPSIRNSHFSVFSGEVPRGSFSRTGSSTLPAGEAAGPSLYQRPENADERADMVCGTGKWVVVQARENYKREKERFM